MAFDDTELTQDAFLGGRVRLWQPRAGYRAGIDPVLLAASVVARPGERILDLGCGAGAVSLCLAARVLGLRLAGVELQPEYADLARRNAAENGADLTLHEADVTALPAALRQQPFDHVVANPPYFDRSRGTAARDKGRDMALGGAVDLGAWVQVAARRVRPGGTVTFIHRAESLPELLHAFGAHLGSLRLLPIQPRRGRPARLIVVTGRKGGRAAFGLCAPLILHAGDRHLRDGDDYTPAARAVLREAAALEWPC